MPNNFWHKKALQFGLRFWFVGGALSSIKNFFITLSKTFPPFSYWTLLVAPFA